MNRSQNSVPLRSPESTDRLRPADLGSRDTAMRRLVCAAARRRPGPLKYSVIRSPCKTHLPLPICFSRSFSSETPGQCSAFPLTNNPRAGDGDLTCSDHSGAHHAGHPANALLPPIPPRQRLQEIARNAPDTDGFGIPSDRRQSTETSHHKSENRVRRFTVMPDVIAKVAEVPHAILAASRADPSRGGSRTSRL